LERKDLQSLLDPALAVQFNPERQEFEHVFQGDNAGQAIAFGNEETARPGLVHQRQGLNRIRVRADGIVSGTGCCNVADFLYGDFSES